MHKVMHEKPGPVPAGQDAAIDLRVLILEDKQQDVELCLLELKKAGFELHADVVDTEEAFAGKLRSQVYDLILSDYGIPAWSGVDAFRMLKHSGKKIPFILVTGSLGEEAAVDLIKEGITDYILKDRLTRLPSAVHRALKEKTARDEHERALRDLRKSEARVRHLVESSIIGISIGDLDGKIIDANDAFLKLLGFNRDDLASGGMRWDNLTPPEYHESDQRAVEQLRITGVAPPWEKEFFRKDGGRISVLIGVTALVAADGDVECVTFVVDISERRQLERQLRQAQKMEAIGRLAGGIAHDFNNLLGVIIGWSEVFEDRMDKNDPLRPKAEQIKKAGQSAAQLTRQLLAFSRQQVLEPKILDLSAVVADTLKMLKRLIGEDIELVTVSESQLGRVKADQGQIDQVIMNLAVNARDAMPRGGKLTITISNTVMDDISIRQHPGAVPGSYVLLAISDTGCGMDRETQSHIFEPFFTTKELGKGTGLGLSTVYGVVKQSGGYISVYSEVGQGTTFKIYLPRIEKPLAAAPAAQSVDVRGWETVLLVEDAAALRELGRELLEATGYKVLEAANSFDAIRVADDYQDTIHLLMTDVVMPGMDGRKLAEHMIKNYPGIKVLYMSGYTDDAIMHHGVLEPGLTLLQKPFTRDTFTRKVREVLGVNEKLAGVNNVATPSATGRVKVK
jgi:two-component system, cell cycle sensor histidine kinase and response regulator CckA